MLKLFYFDKMGNCDSCLGNLIVTINYLKSDLLKKQRAFKIGLVAIFLVVFLIVFITYYLFVIRREKFLEKFINGKEVYYLKKVYKLKIKKEDNKKIAIYISLTNSFIIAFTIFIISFFKSFILQMLIGFASVMVLIILLYHIVGKLLQKNGR